MIDYIYDTECYPNIWSIGLLNADTADYHLFEISWRRNQLHDLINFLATIANDRMVGFNNIGYDYPVLHFIINNWQHINEYDIFKKSSAIINTPFNARFSNIIWDNDQHIKQLDLYKIHHFDNVSKATSLKVLEFNMRSHSIEDLPYKPGTLLNWDECQKLIDYMHHDITETFAFYKHTEKQIKFREELTEKYERNFMNHNDTKIGKDYFIMQLEKMVPGFNKRNQTPRDQIIVNDILFPYIQFEHPEFQRIHNWFKSQVITDTKGAIKDINCNINGFQFDFGTGGIHGSVDSQIVSSDDGNVIIDIDVASYYPNIAIKNRLYPEHLGEMFCDIYSDVYDMRKQYTKGTTENAMLKLALNGTYGDSNSVYSPFYDPQYTMSITINGQLLLCMLAEKLLANSSIEMIQINTDGLTIKAPRNHVDWVNEVCTWWEQVTNLTLEQVEYSRMFIRDVNNYIAEYTDGKLKRKGTYEYDIGWHQNHSALVVPKAAEAYLVYGTDIRQFIENHQDMFDFMLRTKVPRSSKLVIVGYDGQDQQVQNVSRYYISCLGFDLVKVMPPTPSQVKKYHDVKSLLDIELADKKQIDWWKKNTTNDELNDRRFGINKGWKVSICNNMDQCNSDDIDFEWYIKEALKLVEPLR